jgi:hypothetical protein
MSAIRITSVDLLEAWNSSSRSDMQITSEMSRRVDRLDLVPPVWHDGLNDKTREDP